MQHTAKIFSGTGSQYLAEKISQQFGTPSGKITVQHFSDGEIQPIFNESIRGDMVFLVQSTCAPAENLLELLLMIDAARRASAYKVVAVQWVEILVALGEAALSLRAGWSYRMITGAVIAFVSLLVVTRSRFEDDDTVSLIPNS